MSVRICQEKAILILRTGITTITIVDVITNPQKLTIPKLLHLHPNPEGFIWQVGYIRTTQYFKQRKGAFVSLNT